MSPTSSPTPSLSSRDYRSPSPPHSPRIDLSITPTSKVKALLAQFSDDSDDEPVILSKAKKANTSSSVNLDDEDDEELPVARSRVRVTQKIAGSDDEDEDVEMADADTPNPGMSAADRLRMRLFGNKAEKEPEKESDHNDEDEDGETTPKPARRRILKKKKSSPIQSPTISPIRLTSKSVSPKPNGADTITKSKKQRKSTKGKGKASEKKSKKSKKSAAVGSGSGSEQTLLGSGSDNDSLGSLDEDETAFLAESKLQQLVNEKRRVNKQKEDAEEAKRQARLESSREMQDADLIFSDESGGEAGKKLRKKPAARKASKKALFEMRAETQRIARDQEFQLEPPEKIVHSVDSLWEIFGLPNPNAKSEPAKAEASPPEPSSSVPITSEVEQSSPPTAFSTSPAVKVDKETAQHEPLVEDNDEIVRDDEDMPTLEELMAEQHAPKKQETIKKGKEKAVDKDVEMLDLPKGKRLGFASLPKTKPGTKRKPVVELIVPATSSQDPDDSDDLEILPPKPAKPATKSDPIKDLKRLANQGVDHIKLRGRYAKGPVRDPNWQEEIVRKAKEQIKAAEEEKKEALRAQGIYIPTQEEVIKDALFTEDLVEKARKEAQDQKDRERREEAKRRGIRLADLSDDSDDGDFKGSGSEEDEEDEDVAYSGSESEHEEEEEEVEEAADEEMAEIQPEEDPGSPPSAQRSSSPIRLSNMRDMAESDDEDLESAVAQVHLRRRGRGVVKDDEDEEDEDGDVTVTQYSTETPKKAVSFKSSGLPMGLTQMFTSSMASEVFSPSQDQNKSMFGGLKNQPPVLGLTQMFDSQGDSQPANPFAALKSDAPVMGLTQMFNSQADSQTSPSKENTSFSALKAKSPVMGLTQMFESSMNEPTAGNRMDILRGDIPDDLNISQIPLDITSRSSQMETENNSFLDLAYSQSQIQYEPESLLGDGLAISTQMSFALEPDMGFQYNPKDAPPRFRDSSQATVTPDYHRGFVQSGLTEATVLLSPEPTMPRKKKGRLIRKNKTIPEEDGGSEKAGSDAEAGESGSEDRVNAFSLLGKKSKKMVEAYDKKNSDAKAMIQEAAEESEDEYAGLGGGSEDEETDDEALAEMADMIDNETRDDDDRAHAELDLKRAVAEDEKMIQKVMKDVKNKKLGKRGGYDLDDDSEDEARDRMLRRQKKNEAERRRILMQDKNIAKLDNPKRQAFLNTIEDSKGERNFLDEEGEDDDYDFAIHGDSQAQAEEPESIVEVPDSQSTGPAVPPTDQSIIEVPDSQLMVAETPEGHKIGNPRRTVPSKKRKQHAQLLVQRTVSSLLEDSTDKYRVEDSSDSDDMDMDTYEEISKRRKVNFIDRVAVKRSATTTSETAKLAFHQGNTDPTGQFRIPLLRRTTTQDISETTTVAPKVTFVETTTKMARGKAAGASINFQAREATRQKNLEKATNSSGRKREEKKVMGARRANAADVFNAGGFS